MGDVITRLRHYIPGVENMDYANKPMQHAAIFHRCKNDNFHLIFFLLFSYFCSKQRLWVHVRSLSEAVLTSTHNLCFRAKIRKMNTPVNPSFTI